MSVREIVGEMQMSMKRGTSLALRVLGTLWFSAWPAAAQSGVELSHGYFHVLRAQSQFSDESGDDLPALKADAYTPHDTPFDIPTGMSPKKPDGKRRAVTNPSESVAIQPALEPKPDTRVRWMSAMMQSLYYTGIMHGFRTATDPGTRDTLNGHWFQNYPHSLGSLRGWSDGVSFMAPYVGHSLEGSVF